MNENSRPRPRYQAASVAHDVAGARVGLEIRCAACTVTYTEEQWTRLRIRQLVSGQEVRRLVLNWPTEIVIEVRHCSRCGHLIPMKRQATPEQ